MFIISPACLEHFQKFIEYKSIKPASRHPGVLRKVGAYLIQNESKNVIVAIVIIMTSETRGTNRCRTPQVEDQGNTDPTVSRTVRNALSGLVNGSLGVQVTFCYVFEEESLKINVCDLSYVVWRFLVLKCRNLSFYYPVFPNSLSVEAYADPNFVYGCIPKPTIT